MKNGKSYLWRGGSHSRRRDEGSKLWLVQPTIEGLDPVHHQEKRDCIGIPWYSQRWIMDFHDHQEEVSIEGKTTHLTCYLSYNRRVPGDIAMLNNSKIETTAFATQLLWALPSSARSGKSYLKDYNKVDSNSSKSKERSNERPTEEA